MNAAALFLILSSTVAVRVVASPDDVSTLEPVEKAVHAGFRKRTGTPIVSTRAVDARLRTRTAKRATQQARARADAGRNAYRKLELDRAAQLLGEAASSLEKNLIAVEDGGLADIYLDLGLVQLEAGRAAESARAFRKARFFGAPAALDPESFPSKAMAAYAKGSAAAEGAGLGALAIDGSPEGAKVWVDGRAVGNAPLVLTGVIAGEHVVRARIGGAATSRRITLAGGETKHVTVRVPAKNLRATLTWREAPETNFSTSLSIGEALDARAVLIVGIDGKGGAFVRVIDVQKGALVYSAKHPLDAPAGTFRAAGEEAARAAYSGQ